MIYLTFNDAPGGVYYSQVIGVCKYLQNDLEADVKLISIISSRNFAGERRKIKNRFPSAIVLPAFPKLANWRQNVALLYLVSCVVRDRRLVARGPFAAGLGLRLKKLGKLDKVVYDGRGAVAAEWSEYSIGAETNLDSSIADIERHAVLDSDFRIAVSHELVNHWREAFGYSQNAHSVIPCTLNADALADLCEEQVRKRRAKMGYGDDDIVFVYSGSSAGWQSFDGLDRFLVGAMKNNAAIKVLFLAKIEVEHLACYREFPDRVTQDWVEPGQVVRSLSACDYGLMIREPSTTNKVAAPTKFAEYLAAGLPVLISPEIGDYSRFVKEHSSGLVISAQSEKVLLSLETVNQNRKLEMQALAQKYFSKQTYMPEYKKLGALV